MVIVEAVALSIMVCNDLVMPIILHRRRLGFADRNDMGAVLLNIRRGAIVVVLMLAYVFYRLVGDSPGAGLHRAAVLRGRRAVRSRLFWRARLAARHGARRHRGHTGGFPGLELHAPVALLHQGRTAARRTFSKAARGAWRFCARRCSFICTSIR